jgi:hypothetical protein
MCPQTAYVFRWENPEPESPSRELMAQLLATGVDAGKTLEDWGSQWEVQKIISTRVRGGKRQYLLKWRGFSELSWVDASDLNCPELIAEFQEENSDGRRGKIVGAQMVEQIVGVVRMSTGLMVTVRHEDGSQEMILSSEAKVKYPTEFLDFLASLATRR